MTVVDIGAERASAETGPAPGGCEPASPAPVPLRRAQVLVPIAVGYAAAVAVMLAPLLLPA